MSAMSSEGVWNAGIHNGNVADSEGTGPLRDTISHVLRVDRALSPCPVTGGEDNVSLEVAINGIVSSQRKMMVTRL